MNKFQKNVSNLDENNLKNFLMVKWIKPLMFSEKNFPPKQQRAGGSFNHFNV